MKIPIKGSKTQVKAMTQKPVKEDDKTATDVSEEVPPAADNGKMSLFHRLFAPGSMETDVSDDSQYDSQDSRSQYTDMTGSLDEDEEDGHDESTGEPSASSTLIKFDRELRARHRAACKNMTSGKYAKAIKTFESILSDLLERYGEEHERVGAALHNVAVANLRAGLLDDARDAIEEAVRIRKLTLGEDHAKVADSLVEYGIILLSMKKYGESIKVFQQALELRRFEGEEAEDREAEQEAKLKMAKIRHNIGCVNFELGNLDEAKRNYIGAIEEQRAIFGTWKNPFTLMTDTSKPGYLTMASTMCNKGYIDLEQENFKDAIFIFMESLKIQKVLLEANNKLILSTMENIGYCYCRTGEFDKAAKTYRELVKLQSETYSDQSQRGWSLAMKKLIHCQIKQYEFEDAFDNLRLLEDYLSTRAGKTKSTASDLRRTHKLMGEVNYQIFKFPTLSDYTSRLSCGMCADDRDAIDPSYWFPKKPANGSKMSGHRMTYA
ncbi:tetratricopeptide repeat family protein [Nitzschia inconspicua]|uniref:Tetratricopeptide repeat family protein n=1 Tax=Nitzschia inconspicua TaxID=303405 RepID=A0A9K3L3K7_9STRA|nr:tetratricopeptide repeat family protein [Nitzschia inconspicua]